MFSAVCQFSGSDITCTGKMSASCCTNKYLDFTRENLTIFAVWTLFSSARKGMIGNLARKIVYGQNQG